MALKELLLAAILQWPQPWYPPGTQNPEAPEEFKSRLDIIATAVATESQAATGWRYGHRALAAATLTLWYGETRFAYEVHALGESRWGQDKGKAKCMGQLHQSSLVPKAEWEQLVGSDLASTRRCARATMRVIVAMSKLCAIRAVSPPEMARVFAAYGSGRGCKVMPQATKRANRWSRLMLHISRTNH